MKLHLKSLCSECQKLALQAGVEDDKVDVITPIDLPDNAYGFKVQYIPTDTSEVDKLMADLRAEVDRLGNILGNYEMREGKIVRGQ